MHISRRKSILLVGLFSRGLLLLWWVLTPFGVDASTDVVRYANFATADSPSARETWFPWEYPTLARWVIDSIPNSDPESFALCFIVLAFVADLLLLLWLLSRAEKSHASMGVWIWAVVPPLLGSVIYTRYDIFVACLVAVAIGMARDRPVVAAFALSIATALKLWPLVLLVLVVLIAPRGRRVLVVAAGLLPFVTIECIGVLAWGFRSFTGPWAWQLHRGIQVESLVAVPQMFMSLGSAAGVTVRFNAWEVVGPTWPGTLVGIVGICSIASVLLVTAKRLAVFPNLADTQLISATSVLIGFILLMTNKVFSPQYVVWSLALIAVLGTCRGSRVNIGWLFLCICLTVLTTVIYPVTYLGLLRGETLPFLLLLVRAVVLATLAAVALRTWTLSLTPIAESHEDRKALA